ncbi:MAG: PQQ-binding-like beta-propeller repeat protein [Phycisphaerae bacterium]
MPNLLRIAISSAPLLVLCSACGIPPEPPPPLTLPTWNDATQPWPMFGQNVRRTARSPFAGPTSDSPASAANWSYTATGGAVINMQPAIAGTGVYFGSWGVLRRDAMQTPDQWDKSDGRVYGLKLASDPSQPESQFELFAPVRPATTPVGYLFAGRTRLSRDEFWCGAGNDYLVSFYNGTVEGTPLVDPDDNTLYVGRGDGRLYAIDPGSGAVRWAFATFNPQNPSDPDGGGEIVGGAVMGAEKKIYFATLAAPWPGNPPNDPAYETNAVYALDTGGHLLWRYPSANATLANWIITPPAISRDGRTLYVGTFGLDLSVPGELLAIDLAQPDDAPDSARLKWKMTLRHPTRLGQPNLYLRALAVGVDDRIYCGGFEPILLSDSPALFAIVDRGDRGQFAWTPAVVEPQGAPSSTGQFVAGLALFETGDHVETIFASTTHVRGLFNGAGGALFAIDPGNGAVRASFDPATLAQPGHGGMTAPIVDSAGHVYAGIRGLHPLGSTPAESGHMYGLSYSPAAGFGVLFDRTVDGLLDWAAPAIAANHALYFGSSAPFTPGGEVQWFTPSETPANRSPRFYCLHD